MSSSDNQMEGQTVESSNNGTSSSSTLELRCLIDNAQVGGIIGKGGVNVKRVREESGAYVSILKSEYRQVAERIMIIKGTTQQIGHAALLVTQSLCETIARRDPNAAESAVIKVLVHKTGVGCIIGKVGAVIKETQSETGARVQVSNDVLPQSSEKTVTVTGNPEQMQKAMERLATQLRDSPLKAGVKVYPYVPGAQMFNGSPYASMGNGPFPNPPLSMYPPGMQPMQQQYGAPPPAVPSTQKIAIPTVCAGCVIGKSGSVIKDLRAQSATNISIADPDPSSPNERVVTLTGAPQCISHAVYLIKQLVEQYQPSQNAQNQTSY